MLPAILRSICLVRILMNHQFFLLTTILTYRYVEGKNMPSERKQRHSYGPNLSIIEQDKESH